MKYLKNKTGIFLTAAGLFLTLNFMPTTSWDATSKSINEISQSQKIIDAMEEYGIDSYNLPDGKTIKFYKKKNALQVEITKNTIEQCTNPHKSAGTFERTIITDKYSNGSFDDTDIISYYRTRNGCKDDGLRIEVNEEIFYVASLSAEMRKKAQKDYIKILKEAPGNLKALYEEQEEKGRMGKEDIQKRMLKLLE